MWPSLGLGPWRCLCGRVAALRLGDRDGHSVVCQPLDIAARPHDASPLPSYSYGGGSFSFSNLIQGVTRRFSTEFELQQVRSLGPWGSCLGGSRHSAPTKRQGLFIRQRGSMRSGLLHVQRKLGIQTS